MVANVEAIFSEEGGNAQMKYTDHLDAVLQRDAFVSKGERTRFRLKAAAARVLEDGGYPELKVTDICRQADVALGTFYVYFPDKSAITGEVLMDFANALYANAESLARGGDDYEALHRTNTFFVIAYQHNAGLVRCLVQFEELVPEFREAWRECRVRWLTKIARSLARRAGRPEIPDDAYLQIAFALEGMVFHYLYDTFVRQEPLLNTNPTSAEDIVELLSLLWYRAVYNENPPSVHGGRATILRRLGRKSAGQGGDSQTSSDTVRTPAARRR